MTTDSANPLKNANALARLAVLIQRHCERCQTPDGGQLKARFLFFSCLRFVDLRTLASAFTDNTLKGGAFVLLSLQLYVLKDRLMRDVQSSSCVALPPSPPLLHPSQMRVGLAVGPAVAGVVGTGMLRYHLFGPLLTEVTQLEQECEVGGINASADFVHALGPSARLRFSMTARRPSVSGGMEKQSMPSSYALAWSGSESTLLRQGEASLVGEASGSGLLDDSAAAGKLDRAAEPAEAAEPEGDEMMPLACEVGGPADGGPADGAARRSTTDNGSLSRVSVGGLSKALTRSSEESGLASPSSRSSVSNALSNIDAASASSSSLLSNGTMRNAALPTVVGRRLSVNKFGKSFFVAKNPAAAAAAAGAAPAAAPAPPPAE